MTSILGLWPVLGAAPQPGVRVQDPRRAAFIEGPDAIAIELVEP